MKVKKDELLKELAQLTHPDGRKIRSDKGKSRESYKPRQAIRSDANKKRQSYNKNSPEFYNRQFQRFLTEHQSPDGTGDLLIRDANMIFPPHITNYYKLVKPKGRPAYRSSVKRNTHPEELRWNWMMAEYRRDPERWGPVVCNWYFITPEDLELDLWTYPEWAWSYKNAVDSHENREDPLMKVILLYEAFVEGAYGYIEYDNKGNIVWEDKL